MPQHRAENSTSQTGLTPVRGAGHGTVGPRGPVRGERNTRLPLAHVRRGLGTDTGQSARTQRLQPVRLPPEQDFRGGRGARPGHDPSSENRPLCGLAPATFRVRVHRPGVRGRQQQVSAGLSFTVRDAGGSPCAEPAAFSGGGQFGVMLRVSVHRGVHSDGAHAGSHCAGTWRSDT
jgi:hypothetical protein